MNLIFGIGRRLSKQGRGISVIAAPALLLTAPIAAQTEHYHNEAGLAAAPNYAPKTPAISPTPYDLGINVMRSDGVVIDLSTLKGRPTIMTMFFASCPNVCPLMTHNILRAESQIPEKELEELQVVLVSFDDRDNPAVLERYREVHGIKSPRWTVAMASPEASQMLAGLLGVRFQNWPNGSYSHIAMIALIAADGTILARMPSSSLTDPQFRAAVRAMLSMPGTSKHGGKK